MQYNLPGDSEHYELLTKGVELSKDTEGLCCEIGLRAGGGTKYIIDAIAQHCPSKTHIAIDPYGNIPYEHKEGEIVRLNYDNTMMASCLSNVYPYALEKGVHFLFYPLEDTEFIHKFFEGVPVYKQEKKIENSYSFVHFDGPHCNEALVNEIEFFRMNIRQGACWCFDDVTGYYDHDIIEQYIMGCGFKLIQKTYRKALYQYEG